ncbi:hypothetical protein [Pseudonocardia kunmingensis]|uniref:hypothetical protein n=1 Tax=Pseudonocardia kunmingensis TaxID=630975 RepID=UPI0011523D43|nr:hypothetical protein [Pseudonocardia kunmingensis]
MSFLDRFFPQEQRKQPFKWVTDEEWERYTQQARQERAIANPKLNPNSMSNSNRSARNRSTPRNPSRTRGGCPDPQNATTQPGPEWPPRPQPQPTKEANMRYPRCVICGGLIEDLSTLRMTFSKDGRHASFYCDHHPLPPPLTQEVADKLTGSIMWAIEHEPEPTPEPEPEPQPQLQPLGGSAILRDISRRQRSY